MNIKVDKNNSKKQYVSRDDVLTLLMNHIGDYSTSDLGWWLETKTANNFTVVELEFIKGTFCIIREIGRNLEEMSKSAANFEKEWRAKIRSQQL